MRSRWRFPVCFALGALALVVGGDLLVVPWHERWGGQWSAWVGGVVRTIELPGLVVAETFGARFRHRAGWLTWVLMLAATLPIYMLAGAALRALWVPRSRRDGRAVEPTPPPASELAAADIRPGGPAAAPVYASPPPAEPGDPPLSRRGLLLLTRRAAVSAVAAAGAYAYVGEPRRVEVTRRTVRIPGLPPPLDGLRLVQLSDVHHGPWTSLADVRRVVRLANALCPDLVVLTGDYVYESAAYIAPVVRELAALRGSIGVVATLGNHDWWEDGRRTIAEFAKTDVRLVDRGRLFVTGDRTLAAAVGPSDERHALCVAGVGDLWEDPPDYRAALDGLPRAMPRVLLSHNPDVAEEPGLLALRPRIGRVDLMLSGHTHGGQMSFPLIGTPVTLSKYGTKYASGLVQGPLGPVYVNRGIGSTILPMRLGVRPEIAVIELRGA